jgi:hypothetical protein
VLYNARRAPIEQRLPLALRDTLWLLRESPVLFRPRRSISDHRLSTIWSLAVAKLDLVKGGSGDVAGSVVDGVLATSVTALDDPCE